MKSSSFSQQKAFLSSNVQVNVSQERYRELRLEKEMEVYVIPKEIKAFIEGETA